MGTVRVYPNPATEYLIIENFAQGTMQWSLFNSAGKPVTVRAKDKSGSQTKLFLTDLVPGVYYLRFTINNKTEVKKIVIRR